MWETLVVILIVAVAAWYAIRRFWSAKDSGSCGCGCGSGNDCCGSSDKSLDSCCSDDGRRS